jgi:hypothetical protein
MADLDFSHSVSEVPAGESLPAPYKGREKVSITQFPDMTAAINDYASSTNWMSNIGSYVAGKASNAIAEKIGGELGKNPQGDIGIPLTDFDKTMQESYNTQAQATLGLQANKLITDSALDAAKLDRITPDTIKKTNDSINLGLQNIFKNAPSQVAPSLQLQYGTHAMGLTSDLTNRMISEQHEDTKNNTALASQTNNENAYSFGLKNNDKAGKEVIESTRRLNASLVSRNLLAAQDAKSRVDSVRQSYLTGKVIHDYNNSPNKEAYLKSLADNKPDYISDTDYKPVINNTIQYVGQQNSLRSQDQVIRLTHFQTSVAMNPMAPDMPQQLQQLKDNVSPEAYEKAQLYYVNAVKAFNTENGNMNAALAGWNDPATFATLTEKGINKAFATNVGRYIQQRQQEGNPITQDEAEVQVASSAGGRVPVFEKSIENKLLSGNPNSIASAASQIDLLNNLEAGRVYAGVSSKAKAVATIFNQQRGSMPDTDLARQITDNLSNVDDKMQKTLDNSWNLELSIRGASGMGATNSLTDFALAQVKLDKNKVGGSYFATIYGNDIYNQLNSNYITTRGDYNAALQMTQDYVKQHYAETYINGKEQISDSPVEKYIDNKDYKGNDLTPYVQKDILNQLSGSFAKAKEAHPGDYWETLPLKNNVAEVVRNVNGKQYRYPINLVGRAGNQWDVVVQTPYGQRNLFLVAPHVGVTTYKPNKEAILKDAKSSHINHGYIGRG